MDSQPISEDSTIVIPPDIRTPTKICTKPANKIASCVPNGLLDVHIYNRIYNELVNAIAGMNVKRTIWST